MINPIKKFFKKQENEYSIRSIVSNIGELNEKYIKLFIDLHTHWSLVDADFYIAAQAALTEQYKIELDLLKYQELALTEEKFYLAKGTAQALEIATFRRRFHIHKESTPMKEALDARIAEEAGGYLNKLLNVLEPPEEESGDEPEESEAEEATEKPQDAPEVPEEAAAEEPEADGADELEELYELEEEQDAELTEPEPQEGEIPPVYYNDVSALSFVPQSSEAEPEEEPEAEEEPGEGEAETETETETENED